jgi:hypothetical protein
MFPDFPIQKLKKNWVVVVVAVVTMIVLGVVATVAMVPELIQFYNS